MASAASLAVFSRRASPITTRERELILALVASEPILANKSTEGKIICLKKAAWERIAGQVNAAGYGEKKTAYQLQKIWERIKAKAKRDQTDVKRECRKTEGGLPPTKDSLISLPPTALDEETQKTLSFIGTEADDISCDFDSDATIVDITVITEEEEVQLVGATVTPSATITKAPEAPLPKNVLADSPVLPEASPEWTVTKGAEGAVKSQPANTAAACDALTPQLPDYRGGASAARNQRHRRFETTLPALSEGTLWRKETFSRQQELLIMQKETEALRQELLRTQLGEAETRARIALLEEEVLKNKLAK